MGTASYARKNVPYVPYVRTDLQRSTKVGPFQRHPPRGLRRAREINDSRDGGGPLERSIPHRHGRMAGRQAGRTPYPTAPVSPPTVRYSERQARDVDPGPPKPSRPDTPSICTRHDAAGASQAGRGQKCDQALRDSSCDTGERIDAGAGASERASALVSFADRRRHRRRRRRRTGGRRRS